MRTSDTHGSAAPADASAAPPHRYLPPGSRREVVILGSTGSIGTQAIEIALANPQRFAVTGLAAAGGRVELLADQAARLGVGTVAVADPAAAEPLRAALAERGCTGIDLLSGPQAASTLAAKGADVVLNGMTGAIGLEPTLAALDAGSLLALANKESLIIGGPVVKRRAAPGQIVPVDSEHSALAQALRSGSPEEVERLIVTASGGPFRGWSREQMAPVTTEQALNHPTWSMGPVITINSASLMNKGLELIEAHLLFDIPMDRIGVAVHPQSIVHSMVEFVDGSILAQCSPPDMRLPIALGLGWPYRVPGAAAACDFSVAGSWDFEPLDEQTFRAVGLARECGTRGATYPAVYNAANEVGVDAFLAGRAQFLDIVDTVAQVVQEHRPIATELTVEDVLAADQWARQSAARHLGVVLG